MDEQQPPESNIPPDQNPGPDGTESGGALDSDSITSPVFTNHYPPPDDQLAYELNLRDAFGAQFPDFAPILNKALSDIQLFSGIKIPMYKLAEPLSDNSPSENSVIDELGFLDEGNRESGYSMLLLNPPIEHTDEEISQMSEEERTEANKTHTGHMIVGDIPPATAAMLNGIYGLIGAETIRDDRAAGKSEGTVLRLGVYQGAPIYIAENYKTHSYYSGKPYLIVRLVGKNDGETLAQGLPARAQP